MFVCLAHLIENPEAYQASEGLFDLRSCVFKVPAPFLCISQFCCYLLLSWDIIQIVLIVAKVKSDWKTHGLHSRTLNKTEKRTGEKIVPTEE